jgi:hypothetical protein
MAKLVFLYRLNVDTKKNLLRGIGSVHLEARTGIEPVSAALQGVYPL